MFNFCIKSINFVFLVLNWLSNLEFRRRKQVEQVVQIGGSGRGGGNLDKIQKNSSFFSGNRPQSLNWVISRHTASPQLKTSRLGFKLPSPLSQNSSNTPYPSNLPKNLCPKFNPTQSIWDSLIFRANTCLTAIIAVRQVLHCSAMHDDSDFKGSSGGLTIHNANCIEELKWGRKWNF